MTTLEKMDEKLNNTLESKIELEKNEQVQDNDLQTSSTVPCVFSITAKEQFQICFSSPRHDKRYAEGTYTTRMQQGTDPLFFQIPREEIVSNSLVNTNSKVNERYITSEKESR